MAGIMGACSSPPAPNPALDSFRGGLAVLRRDGEVSGHVATTVRASAAVDLTPCLPDRSDRPTYRVNGHRDVGGVGRPVAHRGAHHRTAAPL